MSQGERSDIAKPGSPVFLEPHSYRRRRLLDGARILPAFGVLLWMVPLLWPTGTSDVVSPVSMSSAMLYIFAVWAVLICISTGIWVKTRRGLREDTDDRDRASEQPAGSE
jgi:hypothetical protein